MPRIGRPIGEIRAEILMRFTERARWRADEIAQAVQVPVPVARYTLSRLAAAGQVHVVAVESRASGGRPAHVYAVPAHQQQDDDRPAWLR